MEDFVKDQDIPEISEKEKNLQLLQSIADTKLALKKAHINFELAEDELIDFYTYEIKANQSKLDYLTRIAKSKNIFFSLEKCAN